MSYETGRKRSGGEDGGHRGSGGLTPGKRSLTDRMSGPYGARTEELRRREQEAGHIGIPQGQMDEHAETLLGHVDEMGDQTLGFPSGRSTPGRRGASRGADDPLAIDFHGDASGILDDRAIERARLANPRMLDELAFDPAAFSPFPVHMPDFALDVAIRQQKHGLHVDGIAGPKTCKALLIPMKNSATYVPHEPGQTTLERPQSDSITDYDFGPSRLPID